MYMVKRYTSDGTPDSASGPAGPAVHAGSSEGGSATAPGTLELAAVYRRHFKDVCRWAGALGGPGIDVDDIAQEVFLVVSRKLPDFRGDDPTSWLYGITVRMVRGAKRRAWWRSVLSVGAAIPEDAPHPGPTPDELAERRGRERGLYELLGKMSEKRRVAFALFEIAGYSAEEIARLEGVPAATVRTRLLHARKDFIRLAARHRRRSEGAGGSTGGDTTP